MTAAKLPLDQPNWQAAFGVAVAGHVALGAAILIQQADAPERLPDPVMVVELAGGAPPAVAAPQPQEQPEAAPQPQFEAPVEQVEAPRVDGPTSRDPVVTPPIQQRPRPLVLQPPSPSRATAQRTVSVPANPASQATNAVPGPGTDPEAERIEADYKSLVGSYIRRSPFRPREARRQGISGTTAVRFVVNRRGRISNVGVASSSGSDVLDREAVEFIERLSPVPRFPRDLRRDEIPLRISLKFELDRD